MIHQQLNKLIKINASLMVVHVLDHRVELLLCWSEAVLSQNLSKFLWCDGFLLVWIKQCESFPQTVYILDGDLSVKTGSMARPRVMIKNFASSGSLCLIVMMWLMMMLD